MAAGNFDLRVVDPVVAAELPYGIAQRDRDEIILVPARIRRILV
ncbi:hypothetical protein [Nocardia coffeae]|nr:hypothetical protein [Nocardia coffeae]